MIVQVPVRTEPLAYTMSVQLDGATYTLAFRINRRDGFWRMTLSRNGAVLLEGIKLVNGMDLLAQFGHIQDLPPGRLIVHDLDGRFTDPSETNFGDRVLLLYEEAA